MHVLLVGATSHLASTIIPALLSSPFIHRLVLLSRSSIRSAEILAHDKVVQILHQDFSAIPPTLIQTLRDQHNIQSIVWCIGGAPTRFKTTDEAQAANVSLPLQFLEACIEHGLVPTPSGLSSSTADDDTRQSTDSQPGGAASKGKSRYSTANSKKQPLRFTYFSTFNAEQNSFAALWSGATVRKMKGAAEKALLGLAEEKGQGMLEVYCLRLGKVLDGGQSVQNVLWEGWGGYISDQLVARKTVSLCLGGRGDERYGDKTGTGVLENAEVMGDDWAQINSVTING